MKIKVKNHVETGMEIGYKRGLIKALSLLRKKRIELERHRRKCKEWNRLGHSFPSAKLCPRCAVGAISNVIEPLQFRLEWEKTKR